MEYSFGTIYRYNEFFETVRTKSKIGEERDLKGFETVERKFDDSIITDTFIVLEKYCTKEDSEGYVYNWYIIKEHNREIDRFTPRIKNTEMEITDLEIQLAELRSELAELKK